jgi:hypothetical protein
VEGLRCYGGGHVWGAKPPADTSLREETMTPEVLSRIIERAKTDRAFFHSLVFNPEKIFAQMPELSRAEKSAMLAVKPEAFFAVTFGPVAECGDTCGDRSCSLTCGVGSCEDTCSASSCGRTCKGSCKETVQVRVERTGRQAVVGRPSRSKRRTRRKLRPAG